MALRLGVTLLVLPEHGPAWQSPAERAGCSGSDHGAIPASFALQSCSCGGDRQTPGGCARTAPDTGRVRPPLSALSLPLAGPLSGLPDEGSSELARLCRQ